MAIYYAGAASGDQITVTDDAALDLQDGSGFTWMWWMLLEAQTDALPLPISKGSYSGAWLENSHYCLIDRDSGPIDWRYHPTGAVTHVTVFNSDYTTLYQWHLYTATHAWAAGNLTVKTYVDDALSNTGVVADAAHASTAYDVLIGDHPASSVLSFNGTIGPIWMWEGTLTLDQITTAYHSRGARPMIGIQPAYESRGDGLDGATVTALNDRSGNDNHASAIAGTPVHASAPLRLY
jgi:hypothetical protein